MSRDVFDKLATQIGYLKHSAHHNRDKTPLWRQEWFLEFQRVDSSRPRPLHLDESILNIIVVNFFPTDDGAIVAQLWE